MLFGTIANNIEREQSDQGSYCLLLFTNFRIISSQSLLKGYSVKIQMKCCQSSIFSMSTEVAKKKSILYINTSQVGNSS